MTVGPEVSPADSPVVSSAGRTTLTSAADAFSPGESPEAPSADRSVLLSAGGALAAGSPATGSLTGSSAIGPVAAPRPGDEPAIVVRGLRKRYGELVVLDGLDLEVPHGRLVALLGPNGAGKTTTVEIVEGYRIADGGHVRVLGLDPRRDGPRLRPQLGVMLQQGGITPQGRPGELLRLHARLFAHPADPAELLELLGLAHVAGRRYKLLSGGERQRLALALALVGRPRLLVLDEPTAGMDPAAKVTVRQLIADLRDAGRTILLTTHELADVERLADHVVVIDRGRVLASGTPAQLVAGAGLVLRFRIAGPDGHDTSLGAGDLTALGAALGGTIEPDGAAGRHRLAGAAPDPARVATLARWCAARGLLLAELRTTGGTLEERFLELITASNGDSAGGGEADGDGEVGGSNRRAGGEAVGDDEVGGSNRRAGGRPGEAQ